MFDLSFITDVVDGGWTAIQWIVDLLGRMTAPLQAFITGATHLFNQIMGAFSNISLQNPFSAFTIVAVVGVGYIVIRIIVHLL